MSHESDDLPVPDATLRDWVEYGTLMRDEVERLREAASAVVRVIDDAFPGLLNDSIVLRDLVAELTLSANGRREWAEAAQRLADKADA